MLQNQLRRKKMSKYIEDKKRYLVSRKVEDNESLASIDEYGGNIYWVEASDNAKKFENLDEAKKFIKLQTDLSKLLNKEFEYKILEEHRVVSAVKE